VNEVGGREGEVMYLLEMLRLVYLETVGGGHRCLLLRRGGCLWLGGRVCIYSIFFVFSSYASSVCLLNIRCAFISVKLTCQI